MTRSEPTFRDKGRAAFLAVVVVCSIVAMSAAFVGASHADSSDEAEILAATGADRYYNSTDDLDAEDVWVGQTIAIGVEADASGAELREGFAESDGETVDTSRVTDVGDDHVVTFETSALEDDQVYHVEIYGTGGDDASFWADEMAFDVHFDTRYVVEDDNEIGFEIDSDREGGAENVPYTVDISATGLEATDLAAIFDDVGDVETRDDTVTVTEVDNGDYTADFEDVPPGEYEFHFDVTDTTAEATRTIQVSEERVNRSFPANMSGAQGEMIDVPVALEHTNEGAIVLGDADLVGFETGVAFTDTSDVGHDEIVLQYNTHAHVTGSNDGWRVHPEYADNVTIDDTWVTQAPQTASLDPASYELTIGESADGNDLVGVTDSSWLAIEEATTSGNLSLHTAPRDAAIDDGEYEDTVITETGTLADGDYMIGAFDDLGMGGVVADAVEDGSGNGETLEPVLDELGIVVEITSLETQLNGEQNLVWTTGDTSPGHAHDLELTAVNVDEYDGDQLLFAVEYDDTSPRLDPDERYELAFEITEDNPYVADGETHLETLEFGIEEPSLQWNDNAVAVPINETAQVTGTTNVAPGSVIETRAVASDEFRVSSAADVEHDGSFTATYDFSNERTGTVFELAARHASVNDFEGIDTAYGDALRDEIEAELVSTMDAGAAGIQVDIDVPSEVEVGDSVSLDVTMTNPTDEPVVVEYLVMIDDEIEEERFVQFEADGEFTESYDFDTGVEGEIQWSITTAKNETSGTLTVVESIVGESDDESVPGFGVVGAVVAMLSAATVTLYRRADRPSSG